MNTFIQFFLVALFFTGFIAPLQAANLNLTTNKDTYHSGDTLTLTGSIVPSNDANEPSDIYVAVVLPDSTVLALAPNLTWSATLTPILKSFPIASIQANNFYSLSLPANLPIGKYTFYLVSTPANINPLDSSLWLGSVSTSITFNTTLNNSLQWAWLADTYWYVPTNNLPAYNYSPITNELSLLSDQTVFHIAGYADGYIYGNVVAQINSNTPSCQSLVGSVTPEGNVYLTFNILPYSSGNSPTIGVGTMVKKGGGWTMVNQMSTGSSALQIQIGHWAYMVQTKSGQPSWVSLPGTGTSVEQFLSQCPDNTPIVPIKN